MNSEAKSLIREILWSAGDSEVMSDIVAELGAVALSDSERAEVRRCARLAYIKSISLAVRAGVDCSSYRSAQEEGL